MFLNLIANFGTKVLLMMLYACYPEPQVDDRNEYLHSCYKKLLNDFLMRSRFTGQPPLWRQLEDIIFAAQR